MYFHMCQCLMESKRLPPWRGLSRSRYHQNVYRILMNQNLVNRSPTKIAVQIWAEEGSRRCEWAQVRRKEPSHCLARAALSVQPSPRRKREAFHVSKEEGTQPPRATLGGLDFKPSRFSS